MELNKNGTCQLAIGHADGAPKVEPSIDEPEDDEEKSLFITPSNICM